MFEALSRSYLVFKESFEFIREDKRLLLLPMLSILILIGIATVAVYLLYLNIIVAENINLNIFYWILGLSPIFYFVTFYSVTFFNAALVACAKNKMDGKDPSLGYGLKITAMKWKKLLYWVAIAATLGIFLAASKESRRLEQFLIPGVGLAWSLLSFFILPVLIFEDYGVTDSIKRSGTLFRSAWGKNAVGYFSLTAVMWVITAIGFLPAVIVFGLQIGTPLIGIGLTFFALVLLSLFSASLKEVYVTVLYTYATSKRVPSAFNRNVVQYAFVPTKKNRR